MIQGHRCRSIERQRSQREPDKQLEYALEEDIPLVVLVGNEELGSGTVVIKDLKMRSQANVGEGDLIKEVQDRLRSAGNSVS